ncbi:MAG: TonB-dependent receptor [Steroidobacteraceae bacterium]
MIRPRRIAGSIACAILISSLESIAGAALLDIAEIVRVDIPAEPLAIALLQFSSQTHVQIATSGTEVGGMRSHSVIGSMSISDALTKLLAGTGFAFQVSGDRSVAILLRDRARGATPSTGPPADTNIPKNDVENNIDHSGENAMRHRSLFARFIGLFAVCGSVLHTGTACAEDANTTNLGSNSTTRLEEVVVTAQRREERLQDVPIAVSAISSEQLAAAGIDSTTELQYAVPGFIAEQSGAIPHYAVRGISNTNVGPGVESAVAMYVDGVYISATPSSLMKLSNIERIEVLKGPQGTLFGRNATGGLVQVITKDPQHKPQADASVGYGNYQTFTGSLYATSGIADTLAADLSMSYTNQGQGYGKNLFDGEGYQRFPRDLAARTKWLWEPSAATRVKFAYDYSKLDLKIAFVPFPGPQGTGTPLNGTFYDADSNIQQRIVTQASGGSIDIQHEFDQARLLSITSSRQSESDLLADLDATPRPVVAAQYADKEQQFTEELQLQSLNNTVFSWVVGAYYYYGTGRYQPFRLITGPAVGQEFNSKGTTESWAGFGQGTYEFLPDTHLTLGLRYTSETRDAISTVVIPSPSSASGHVSFDKLTSRLSLDRKFTPNVMGYVSYNRGFQSGGFDLGSVQNGAYQPETIDAYEIGLKSEWFDQRIRFNIAAFHYQFDNLQLKILSTGGTITTINGPKAKLDGADADAAFVLTDRLQVSMGASYVHSEFQNFPNAPYYNYNPNSTFVACAGANTRFLTAVKCDATGNQLPGAPKLSGNLAATYTIPLKTGKIAVDGNLYYNGGWFSDSDNQLKQPAYSVLNGFVSWSSSDDANSIKLWGKNLTDKKYATGITTISGLAYTHQPAPPLTYGLTLQHHFR